MIYIKVAFYTLGCKVNQYETQVVLEMFKVHDYSIVEFTEFADVYVINTCTVTNLSDRKSRQMISKAKKQNSDATIVVMGCFAQTSPQDVSLIEGVSLIIGTKDRSRIVDLVEEYSINKNQINNVNNYLGHIEYEEMSIINFENKTRGFIKIQEGCNQFCTYCIIPYARGPIRSRKLENIISETKKLSENGFREIVLTGIHISSYGTDLKDVGLIDVIREINNIEGIKRIRLGSLEPMLLTNEFVNELVKYKKLCPHFHLSLQSGCDDTLKRMNRKYDSNKYKDIVDLIRSHYKDASITTDIMVGFPGETDEEFKKSYEFAKIINFSKIHVFKYSPRIGTPAFKYSNQVGPKVKEERSKIMIKLSNISEYEFINRFIGTNVEVLFEQVYKKDNTFIEGLTANYIKVIAKGDERLIGTINGVRLEEVNDEDEIKIIANILH